MQGIWHWDIHSGFPNRFHFSLCSDRLQCLMQFQFAFQVLLSIRQLASTGNYEWYTINKWLTPQGFSNEKTKCFRFFGTRGFPLDRWSKQPPWRNFHEIRIWRPVRSKKVKRLFRGPSSVKFEPTALKFGAQLLLPNVLDGNDGHRRRSLPLTSRGQVIQSIFCLWPLRV